MHETTPFCDDRKQLQANDSVVICSVFMSVALSVLACAAMREAIFGLQNQIRLSCLAVWM